MCDQYIKMVLALPDEFFEGWKWKEGDMAISLRDNETKVMITEFDVWSGPKIIHIKPLDQIGFTYLFSLDNLRPIPSQEQLQKKCIDFENRDERHIYSTDFSISKRFIALVIEGDLVHDIENKTLKEMWLEFTEYLVYDKIWNGEAWMPADD